MLVERRAFLLDARLRRGRRPVPHDGALASAAGVG